MHVCMHPILNSFELPCLCVSLLVKGFLGEINIIQNISQTFPKDK